MRVMNPQVPKLALAGFCALLLGACDNPLNCLIDDRPVLDTDSLDQPVLNQVYRSHIGVSIKNNTADDVYDYKWTLTGDLPPGIDYEVNARRLRFTGTATSLGDYPYTVRVLVESDNFLLDVSASQMCRQSVTREYTMSVAPL